MKRLLLLIPVLVLLASCINEDGIMVPLPDSINRQWICDYYDETDGETEIMLWDFRVKKGCITFVYFHSEEDMVMFPQYYNYQEYIYEYDCRLKDGIYTVTLLNDEDGNRFYFADITSESAIVTSAAGDQWVLRPSPVYVSAIPIDY